ncbi:unnamed protein product [Brassica rapa subsp. narinosa]
MKQNSSSKVKTHSKKNKKISAGTSCSENSHCFFIGFNLVLFHTLQQGVNAASAFSYISLDKSMIHLPVHTHTVPKRRNKAFYF